ncbi:uncharacterized protein DDB_G0284459 [Engraulis encrasicolus]|uniref:uncharacterized protein DDB_G0284459 n=1 Tax=Engraulis encrasicolus TaxID=184585 RepID=UPI002FCEDB60
MDDKVDGNCKAAETGGLEQLLILEEGDDIDSIMCNIKKDKCEEETAVVTEESDRSSNIKEENILSTEGEQQEEEETGMSEDRTVKQTEMHKEESGGEADERIQRKTERKDTEADTEVKKHDNAMVMAGTEENVASVVAETVGEGKETASHNVPRPEEPGTDEEEKTDIKSTEVVLRPKTQLHVDMPTTSKDFLSPNDAQKKVNRLSSDFPDALYEFLQKVQEGRRINDQRCSFRLEGQRRRCYSEPSTPRLSTSKAVMFSSMTSLQREEFFELVATSQARRLDDQRAEAESIQPLPPKPQAPPAPASPPQPPKPDRKLSIKASIKKTAAAPAPRPKEELYNMILSSQAQGRLEEQRSRAPGPMDDEDFFSLLLKVQGGRMDEQRTELPLGGKD